MGKIFNIMFRGYRPSRAKDISIPSSTYRDGKYKTTKHAIMQMRVRNISKGALHSNLHTRAIKTGIKFDNQGRQSYKRITSNQIVSAVNPKNNFVNSVWKISKNRYQNYVKRRNCNHEK